MSQVFVSKNNSTNIPLAAGESFEGLADILVSFQEADINIAGDPISAGGTLYFEFSPNGINWDVSVPMVLTNLEIPPVILRSILPYFRVRYINGLIAQTSFRLTTVFHRGGAIRLTRFLFQDLDPNEPIEVVRVGKSELPIGAATETTIANLNAKFNSLGQKTMDGSLSVVLASDQVVSDGYALSEGVTGLMVAGSDGYSSQFLLTDNLGRLIITGAGIAGLTSGGVISIQGTLGGIAVPISDNGSSITVDGMLTANIGLTNGLALDNTLEKLTIAQGVALGINTQVLVGGSVATVAPSYTNGNINPFSLTTAGALRVDGSGVTQPVTQATASNLNAQVQGSAADGASPVGNPILIAGYDGTNVQTNLTDTSGRQRVVGAASVGTAVTGDPVLIGGTDGTNVRIPNIENSHPNANDYGIVVRDIEVSFPTFHAIFDRISPAANKYMATLWNGASGRKVVVQRVWRFNWQVSAVSGASLDQELRKITARTAGTTITPVALDSSDTLTSGIVADHASTSVTDSSLLQRPIAVSEERDALDTRVVDWLSLTPFALVYERKIGTKGIVLRQNEGISFKNITSSTVGTVSYVFEFTDEVA